MKIKFTRAIVVLVFFLAPTIYIAQTITLGSAANFALFTSIGAITNVGPSQITGHVGSNLGAGTGFGNINGNMYSTNGITALAAADLATAYGQLNTATPAFFPAVLLGNGATLTAGVYSLSANTTLNNTLTLNAQGTSTAVFIFQISGTFASNANAVIILTNGAQACNVYWKVEGAVSLAAGSSMKGNIIANNAAITMAAGVTLEGRAFSTSGAIGTNSVLVYTPIGCGSPFLTGPITPTLGTTACYAVFSSDGAVTNVGVTTVTGDIGSNNGSALGFNPLLVSGSIHAIPDLSTAQASVDLGILYTYLNTLPADITLLFPAQFGNNLVLTPHVYLMNGAVTLTDSLFLNAQGNPNAIFVIQINGALSTSAPCKVVLLNGTQAKNVFWKVDGAVSLNAGADFKGTIVANNAAILLATGVLLNGRALTTTGAHGTSASTIIIPSSVDILSPPSSQTVCAGSPAIFTVAASGTGLTYQWRKGTANLINGGNISGATTATLNINPANISDASLVYNLIVSGGCAGSYTSPNVSLVVNSAPAISSQPSSQTVCAGSPATFSVLATGTNLTYQWRDGLVNLLNSGNISGANSATLLFSPVNTTNTSINYNLIVSGQCSPDFTTGLISLLVTTSPTISALVPSQTVCAGTAVSFSVNASGSALNYQWRDGNINLINSGSISGATSATLTFNPVSTANASNNYNLVISGSCAPNFTSANISLVVNSAPTISAQVASQTVCAGASVIFTVNPSGTGLTYQWRNGNVNLINNASVSGANSASLTINPVNVLDASTNYNLIISGVCAPAFTTLPFALDVNTSPTIAAQVPSQTVCAGSAITFSVNSAGTGLTYQWRIGTVNVLNGGSISGANSASLTINPVAINDSSSFYNLVISGVCSPNYTSSFIGLVVNSAPTISTQIASQTLCAGSSMTLSADAEGTGLTYQWREGNLNLVNGGAISGVTTATLIINPVTATNTSSNYNLVISGVCSPQFTSNNINVVINTAPTILSQSNSQTVCEGATVSFSVNSAGSGLSYQWRKGTVNLINGGSISGATSATLTINPVNALDSSSNYNLVISGLCAPNFTSAPMRLYINAAPTITAQAISQTVCAGSAVSFSTAGTGTGLNYQWKKGSTNLVNAGNISGANTATLNINPASTSDAASDYNLVISGLCSPDFTSANISLIINSAPNMSAQVASQTVCAGTTASLKAFATGTGLTYQWTKGSVNIVNGGAITGATTATLNFSPVSASDAALDYHLVISGVCAPDYTSANISLVVDQNLVVNTSGNNTVCVGSAIQFSSNTVDGASHSWIGPADYSSSEQNPIIAAATLANSGSYTLTLSSPGCISATGTVMITVENCIDDDFLIPEGYSPNDDLINDRFVIRGISKFPENKFVVFNRWGNKVFEAAPYKNDWDGKSGDGLKVGSDELPVGTYFYILDLGDNKNIYKGTIYLNR